MSAERDAELERAEALIDLRRPGEAEQLLRSLLTDDPEEPRALGLLGLALLDQDRGYEAVEVAQRAVAAAPDDARAFRLLATALDHVGRGSSAVEAAREAVRLAPWAWDAHYTLGACLRGNGVAPTGTLEEALAEAREAVRTAPHEAATHTLVGLCLTDLGRKSAAEAAYREAVRLDPTDAMALNNLAALRINSGRLAQAGSMLSSGLAADPQEKLLHQNYDALVLRLVRRLYFALLAAAVVLYLLAVDEAPYPARAGTAVCLLAVYAGASYLVTRNLPRGVHLWARGFLRRVSGGEVILVVAFLGFTAVVIGLGLAPTHVISGLSPSALLAARLGIFVLGAMIAASRKSGDVPDLRAERDRPDDHG